MKWLALLLLTGCVAPTALKQECFDIVTGAQVTCDPNASCRIWSEVQADGTQRCWSGE